MAPRRAGGLFFLTMSNPANSPVYRAAVVGLAHRISVFGVDLKYTRRFNGTKDPKSYQVRGVVNAVNNTRNLEAGGFNNDADATLRLAKTVPFTPNIGDTVTTSAGNSYRIDLVADHPTSPEWRLSLANLEN